MEDWYHTSNTVLRPGFDNSPMIRLHEPFNLQINVYFRFLNSAWNVATPTLQNSSLALLHLGFLSRIHNPSLEALWSFWTLTLLYLVHKGAVYGGVQYALNRLISTI